MEVPFTVDDLENEDAAAVERSLRSFTQKNSLPTSFPDLNWSARKKIGNAATKILSNCSLAGLHALALEAVRIVARDKANVESLASEELYAVILQRARLGKEAHRTFPHDEELLVTTEAQKVLCNLVFNSKSAQRYFSREEIVEGLMARISANKDTERWPMENQHLDTKLLFILTILCADVRSPLRQTCRAIQDLCIYATCLIDKRQHNHVENVLCEILKTLFNLVYNLRQEHLTMGEELDLVNMGQVCRELLLCSPSDEVKKHVINLLTVVKKHGYSQLLVSVPVTDKEGKSQPLASCFEGMDMRAIDSVLEFLDAKLALSSDSKFRPDDNLAPVLCALTNASKAVPTIRKYLKMMILPPLTDVHTRPEVGDTMRNKLCRLLTSAVSSVRDNAGDLLYALCRQNVRRLIKYTGYGNAAGWLAEKGLMGLPQPEPSSMENDEDESDFSDTEEYLEHKNKIEPVTGVVREDRPDPMAGMTDEQKEQLAMDLVNSMDRVLRTGVLKPVTIGVDGKPRTVENVMEWREQAMRDRPHVEEPNDSDED
ncbi:hypothetical protein RvY_06970 [Ramazzottius varieornatus]|uniref:Synembryn-A n=1 Tax=Ramazzottius varieornatus TaxID=947166 RepID=A0A1D1V0D8_RAMVA|nr:hypothetical protein RvY_06970 [Ramazzottius varieornatus]